MIIVLSREQNHNKHANKTSQEPVNWAAGGIVTISLLFSAATTAAEDKVLMIFFHVAAASHCSKEPAFVARVRHSDVM